MTEDTLALYEADYAREIGATRDARMGWWRDAAFGMFIHYGVYSVYGRGEWIRLREGISGEEYHRTAAEHFRYQPGNAAKWVKLARSAGMKYAVMTAIHHDGYALWDSAVNPFNSVKCGPGIDIVREFTEACRRHGIRVGLYFSLWNWEHPDGMRCQDDETARVRFLAFVREEVRELMANYGKIDILWYDVPSPLKTAEAWDSVSRNRMVRALQPDIIINNRSRLDEDFCTPEDKIVPGAKDWEACMRFTDIAFGGLNQAYAAPYRLNANGIIRLLAKCRNRCGNLIFNITPDESGGICEAEAAELTKVGAWICTHSEVICGAGTPGSIGANGICTATRRGNHVYLWNWIWGGTMMRVNGYRVPPVRVRCVTTGEAVDFTYENGVIHLRGLPERSPEPVLGIVVYDLDFGDAEPVYRLMPANAEEFAGV